MKKSICHQIKLVLVFLLAAVLLCVAAGKAAPSDSMETTVADVTAAPTVEPETDMVWIPNTGARYHTNPRCSGMKNPEYASIQDAVNRGYTPCKNCY